MPYDDDEMLAADAALAAAKSRVHAEGEQEPDGDICDDSCEWALDGVCDDGTQPAVEARARRQRRWERTSRVAALLVAVAATYAVVHVLAARRRRRERVAATEFKAKVAPYLVEAPEL